MKIYKLALSGDEEAEMLYQKYREQHDRHMVNHVESEIKTTILRRLKIMQSPKIYLDLKANDQGDIINANINVYVSQIEFPHHFTRRIQKAKDILTSRQIHDEIKQSLGVDSIISLHIQYGKKSMDGIKIELPDEVFSV